MTAIGGDQPARINLAHQAKADQSDGYWSGHEVTQGRDAEIARDVVETFAQGLWHRYALYLAIDHLGIALLAGQPDPFDIGHSPTVAQVGDQRIHASLEGCNVAESRDIDSNDGLAGVGGAGVS